MTKWFYMGVSVSIDITFPRVGFLSKIWIKKSHFYENSFLHPTAILELQNLQQTDVIFFYFSFTCIKMFLMNLQLLH